MVGRGRLSTFAGGDERQVQWSGGRGRGAVYDLHGGLVDVQRVDDLQLGPGRRLRRRPGRVGPAGYPQELLDLQSHPAGLAGFLLLATGRPFGGGQRKRGRLALSVLVAAAAAVLFRGRTRPAVRVAVPVAARRLLFHFDLFAVLGQQFAVVDGGRVAGRPIVRTWAVVVGGGGGGGTGVLSDDRGGRLFRRAALGGRRWRRRRRFRRLPFDAAVAAPGTLRRAVTGHRSTLKYGRNETINTSVNIDGDTTHTHTYM